MLAAANAPKDAPLAPETDALLRWAAIVSTGIAVVVAAGILQIAADNNTTYTIENRWFLPATFALVAAFYAIDAFVRRERAGFVALSASLTGIAASTCFALNLNAEYYAFAFVLPAVVLAATARWARHPLLDRLDANWRDDAFMVGYAAVACAAGIATVSAALSATKDPAIDPAFRAYLPLVFVAAAAFSAIDASRKSQLGVIALAAALGAIGAGVVYAIDTSGEMYAFGLLTAAITIVLVTRFSSTTSTAWLPDGWRDDAIVVGRVITGAGIGVALIALGIAEDGTPNTYEPLTRWYLPLAFALAAAFFAIDASRAKREDLTLALLLALGASIVSVPYALEAPAEYYGVALAATGVLFAVGGRAYTPAWIDERVRDVTAVVAVTASWLLFEGAYVDAPRVGAAVHFAAAAFYLAAAVLDRSKLTLEGLVELPAINRIRVASGWLYAAGLTAVIGYVLVLRSLPGSENAEGGTMATSFAFAAIAFALAGAAAKQWRAEFSVHLYIMSLAIALVSLAAGGDAGTLTIILAAYVAMFAAIASYENQPLLAAPSVLFAFATVATYREYADAGWALLPAAYCAIGLIVSVASVAFADNKRWSLPLGVAGALFLAAAPVVGIGLLMSQTEAGRINGTLFYETALYQSTVITVAVLGVVLLGTAAALERRWLIVPATAGLVLALLMQIGRFNPENAQAYTVVIGAYLVLLGALGLSRFKLIPELEELAPYVEGLGAAVFMFPSFLQSIDAGWRYQWILLLEASLFFAAGVALRRRGLLAVSLLALVAVAGRALFDAVNALPNWVVVMVAGVSLLGVGMAILLGRDRWTQWQETLVGWWDDTENGHATS
jgi:hypothetical protein